MDHDYLFQRCRVQTATGEVAFQIALGHNAGVVSQPIGRTGVFLCAEGHDCHAVLDEPPARAAAFLHRGLEIAHVSLVFDHLVACNHLDTVVGRHTSNQIAQKSLRIAAQGIVENLPCPAAQFGLPLNQVNLVALVGQVEGGCHPGHPAAHDQCLVVELLRLGVQRKEQPRAGGGHAHQVFGLAGGSFGFAAVHPTALIADVGHLEEVGV